MPIIRSGYGPRGSREQRGYGYAHRKMRKRIAEFVATGRAVCTRCHKLIRPEEAWDLDHNADRTGYRGPSHASCNRGGVI